jgi:exonuclease SbcC
MRAFGPYAGEQIVDFRAALNAGLFGIYGPTGSGKSSIFSAISFAMFGEAARDDQEASTLRSDHAKPDCLTEVELVFEIGSKRYLVRRRPEQMRPALRGGKETREAHCAWLFDVTGIPLDEITGDNHGTPIAEKKISEVREELERRLGYGPEQFRQIVLLPQGRFETFLSANTNNRLDILRELFDVSLYRRLTHKMKDDAKAAEEKIRAERQACRSRLEQESLETPEALAEGLQHKKEEQQVAATAAEAAKASAVLAEQQLAAANEIEKAFLEHEEAGRALASVLARSEAIQKDQSVLKGAMIARGLSDVDAARKRARTAAETAREAHEKARQLHATARQESENAALLLAAEQAKRAELDHDRQHCDDLKRHRQTLGAAEKKKVDKASAADKEKGAKGAFETAHSIHARLTGQRSEAEARLKTATASAEQRTLLSATAQDIKVKLEAARHYDGAVKAVASARDDVQRAREIHTEKVAALAGAQLVYDTAEEALAGVQALHLAEKLHPGEACPVCGSHDHPAPAKGQAESAGRNEAFMAARKALAAARDLEGKSGRDLAGAQATLAEREANLAEQTRPESALADLESRAAKLRGDLEALGPVVDLAVLRSAMEGIDSKIPDAVAAIETTRLGLEEAKTGLALAVQALESALATVPQVLRETAALEAAITAAEQEVTRRELALESAVKAEREAKEKLIGAAKEEKSALENYERAKGALQAAEDEFAGRLAGHDLTPEQYNAHRANIDRIDALEAAIKSYGQDLAVARARIARAEQGIEGRERPALTNLQAVCVEAARLRDEASEKAATVKARADFLEKLSASITATLEAISKAEEDYAPLAAVAHAFAGQNNAKTELEAFAIAAMFDLVLNAANARLRPMSGGRYTLERDRESIKGGGKRGLGIVVHDVHTGRTRATSTLSGGETFMAALALALGLSDVVESVNGGVHLDAIFIDEGFGTLDNETLDQALQTLQDIVGERRAVGLISHVELVQQAIPHGFQITKTAGGSSVAQRMA